MYRHPPSPSHRPTIAKDEAQLPEGECRYLLLHPELRGQRCACVNFSLNKSTPGSSCECGHGACYHITAKQEPSTDRGEIEALKQKIQRLEEMLDRERYGTRNTLTTRLGELEEVVDKYKTDMESELKSAYRGIEGLWHHVGTLQRRARAYDDRLEALVDANQATQDDVRVLKAKVIEIDDSSMMLEERLDAIPIPETAVEGSASSSVAIDFKPAGQPLQSEPANDSTVPKKHWTVHVSLLPKASQPFPFEKDTTAYSRCLSRGLHRMVAIPGPDSKAFTEKISEEFASLLKGRPWMPLVAKLCDAKTLCGLPMLKPLQSSQIYDKFYDMEFLKQNCAVLDANGNILDLYIAMCENTFSWPELQQSPTFLGDLEDCWEHDSLLDSHRLDDELTGSKDVAEDSQYVEDILSAGDIFLRGWSPPATRLKRTASAVSRTSSFGSTDGDGKRVRIQRPPCVGGAVERVGRRAEAV